MPKIHFLFLGILVPLFFLHGLSGRQVTRVTDDALQHMMLAHNMLHYQTFSDSLCDQPPCDLTLSAYRGPGYPIFIAFSLLLDPITRSLNQTELTKSSQLNPLRNSALCLLLLTALGGFFIVYRLSGNLFASYFTFFSIGFNPILVEYQNEVEPELFSGSILVFLSVVSLLALQKKSKLCLLLAGLLLGILALTIPIFVYCFFLSLIFFFWSFPGNRVEKSLGALFFSIGFVLVVGPWMGRNYLQFGRAFISERGGVILNVRAEKNMMNRDEYVAAFCYWSNCRFLQNLGKPYEENPAFTRLIRGNENSFYKVGRKRRSELNNIHGQVIADKMLTREALKKIIEHPLRHLLVSLPVAYRGINVQSCGIDFMLFGSCAALLLSAFLKRDPYLGAILIPSAFSFLFYTLFTYNLPRYSLPLLPMLWIGTALFGARLFSRADNC